MQGDANGQRKSFVCSIPRVSGHVPVHGHRSLKNGGVGRGVMMVANGSRLQAAIMSGAQLPLVNEAPKGINPSDTRFDLEHRLQSERAERVARDHLYTCGASAVEYL